jgi:hypothetical protein
MFRRIIVALSVLLFPVVIVTTAPAAAASVVSPMSRAHAEIAYQIARLGRQVLLCRPPSNAPPEGKAADNDQDHAGHLYADGHGWQLQGEHAPG